MAYNEVPPPGDDLPNVGLGDQTARSLLSALFQAGAITQTQVDDACEQLVYWRNLAG